MATGIVKVGDKGEGEEEDVVSGEQDATLTPVTGLRVLCDNHVQVARNGVLCDPFRIRKSRKIVERRMLENSLFPAKTTILVVFVRAEHTGTAASQ